MSALAEAGFLIGLEKNRSVSFSFFSVLSIYNRTFCNVRPLYIYMLGVFYFEVFILGLALLFQCSDTVEMASYAPLFVNVNDRRYNFSLYMKLPLIFFLKEKGERKKKRVALFFS